MRNDVVQAAEGTTDVPPAAAPPLLILSADDDVLCTDELCLPADAPRTAEPAEAEA